MITFYFSFPLFYGTVLWVPRENPSGFKFMIFCVQLNLYNYIINFRQTGISKVGKHGDLCKERKM